MTVAQARPEKKCSYGRLVTTMGVSSLLVLAYLLVRVGPAALVRSFALH